jgi:hypothetical protein
MNITIKLSIYDRSRLCDVLSLCLQRLWDGRSDRSEHDLNRCQFICHALDAVWDAAPRSRNVGMYVEMSKRIIMHRLEGESCLEGWLLKNVPDYSNALSNKPNLAIKTQATRIAWVNALIEEFRPSANQSCLECQLKF